MLRAMTTKRSLTGSELLASSVLVVCGLLLAGCPKQQDSGASAEAVASAKSPSAAPKEEAKPAEDKDDDKDDGKKDKGGW